VTRVHKTHIVVPCYDEAERLPAAEFLRFAAAHPDVDFLFVDDGSRDDTAERLRDLERKEPTRLAVLSLPRNRGKAEAVRAGMLEAFGSEARYVGYWDADLSTPLEEIPRFVDLLDRRADCDVALGSRVRLLGRTIERRALRHYVGRVYATLASATLRLPVYDTQCGAKLFRRSPAIEALFAEPFSTRWVFDVEILARLLRDRGGRLAPGSAVVTELPLREWRDVPGSKVRAVDFARSVVELVRVRRRYLR
jgi:glycosyltransferase involved in cell wall biosynthesis